MTKFDIFRIFDQNCPNWSKWKKKNPQNFWNFSQRSNGCPKWCTMAKNDKIRYFQDFWPKPWPKLPKLSKLKKSWIIQEFLTQWCPKWCSMVKNDTIWYFYDFWIFLPKFVKNETKRPKLNSSKWTLTHSLNEMLLEFNQILRW